MPAGDGSLDLDRYRLAVRAMVRGEPVPPVEDADAIRARVDAFRGAYGVGPMRPGPVVPAVRARRRARVLVMVPSTPKE